MEHAATSTIIMFMLQGFLTLLIAFGIFILSGLKDNIKNIYDKLEGYQTKESCRLFHDAHDVVHEMENDKCKDDMTRVKFDVDNLGSKVRKVAT